MPMSTTGSSVLVETCQVLAEVEVSALGAASPENMNNHHVSRWIPDALIPTFYNPRAHLRGIPSTERRVRGLGV